MDDEIQNWLPIELPETSLDKICTLVENENFVIFLLKGRAYGQFYERIRLEFCQVCSKPKFQADSTHGVIPNMWSDSTSFSASRTISPVAMSEHVEIALRVMLLTLSSPNGGTSLGG